MKLAHGVEPASEPPQRTKPPQCVGQLRRCGQADRHSADVVRGAAWHTSTGYGGDRVDHTPTSGGTATSTISGARGRTTALRQYHGPTPTPAVPGSYGTKSYVYVHAVRLSSVTDQAGIGWSWGYDQRGWRTSSVDPDRGTTLSTYDDGGQLASSTDGRGVTLSYVYDELGRRRQLWQGQPGIGTKRAEWVFDTIRLGQPTSSTRFTALN